MDMLAIGLEEALKSFSVAQVQTANIVFKRLEQYGYSPHDLRLFIEGLQEHVKQDLLRDKTTRPNWRICPKCGETLRLAPLNTGKANQTGDNSTFCLLCMNCYYERFTTKTRRELIVERRD